MTLRRRRRRGRRATGATGAGSGGGARADGLGGGARRTAPARATARRRSGRRRAAAASAHRRRRRGRWPARVERVVAPGRRTSVARAATRSRQPREPAAGPGTRPRQADHRSRRPGAALDRRQPARRHWSGNRVLPARWQALSVNPQASRVPHCRALYAFRIPQIAYGEQVIARQAMSRAASWSAVTALSRAGALVGSLVSCLCGMLMTPRGSSARSRG